MTEQNFCYWLKGFFELLEAGPKNSDKLVLTAAQVEMISQHLNYVFAEKAETAEISPALKALLEATGSQASLC